MSIIIGAGPEPAAPNPLPTPEVELPHPASVPAAQPLLDDERIVELLSHERAIVRSFAVEQISRRPKPHLLDALEARLDDDEEAVAIEAITVIDREKHAPAADALLNTFTSATGGRMVALAGAIATVAADRLLAAVQARGRLDDPSYRAITAALAVTGTEPVRAFFDKALNRSGALTGERKSGLYTAVLMNGEPALATRVLTKAVSDSKEEAPDDASFPSRVALGILAGLPIAATRGEAGAEVFTETRKLLERDVSPVLSEEEGEALTDALRRESPRDTLKALAPVLALPERVDDVDGSLRALASRRRGLLEALIARADDLARLELAQAALFVAVAARAAAVALSDRVDEADSAGMVALAKTLETDAGQLAHGTESDLDAVFEGRSARDIRRVVTIVVREQFRQAATVERLAKALTRTGHGRALIDAVAEVEEDSGIHAIVVEAVASDMEAGEAVTVEILTESPLPEDVLPFGLMLAALIRTERVAVAVGRRFFDLRKQARALTSQACLRLADARLIPLLQSRAFADEPEELAWVLLSIVHDQPWNDRLQATVNRVQREVDGPEPDDDDPTPDQTRPQLEVSLQCEVCGETLHYRFERAYVDAEAKDEHGDPAFVGETVCKACGAEDRLVATPETASILTQHMLAYLQAAQRGVPPDSPPLVSPAKTTIDGQAMGLAAALRKLDEQVAERPDSIRLRLHRARTRMVLRRRGVDEDLDAILAIDGDAVEVEALRATQAMREGAYDSAVESAVKALRRLQSESEPRLYDADDPNELQESLEGYLLELSELGATVPDDIDLRRARRMREAQIEALRAAREEAAREQEAPAPAAPRKKKTRRPRK